MVEGANDVQSLVAGHAVEQPAELRGVELVEALYELERRRSSGDEDVAPVSGIVAANDELADAPERINQDPYEAWLFRIKPADPAELSTLLDAAAYQKVAEASK